MSKVFGRKVLGILAICTVIGLSTASLTGCGFVPLYAQNGLTGNLSQVAIEVPQTRTGYFLEQDLRNGLGGDESSPKTFLLTIGMKERHYGVGFTVNDTSTRSEITSAIVYTLKDISTGKVLYTNSFTETATYDTSKSPFTGVISQQNAQERIATAISQQVQRDLALYFHGGLLKSATPAAAAAAEAQLSADSKDAASGQ